MLNLIHKREEKGMQVSTEEIVSLGIDDLSWIPWYAINTSSQNFSMITLETDPRSLIRR